MAMSELHLLCPDLHLRHCLDVDYDADANGAEYDRAVAGTLFRTG